jgi:uncharacterized protein
MGRSQAPPQFGETWCGSCYRGAFRFHTAVIREDDSEVYGESRDVAIGWIDDTLYVYVYTLRGTEDHAISLRKASPKEQRRYVKEA